MGFAGRELRGGVATEEHVQRGERVRGRGMGSGREEGGRKSWLEHRTHCTSGSNCKYFG